MMNRHRSRIVILLSLVLLLFAGIIGKRLAGTDETDKMYRVFRERIVSYLTRRLVSEHHLPLGKSERLPDTPLVAYILGGTQESLSIKLKTVGRLFGEGTVTKILFLRKPGITEYSPVLGRNLTNDEWAIGKLQGEGVPAEAVEFVSVPPATFDTFAEARVISALARSRRVKRLALITSMHHTERVRLSFSCFNVDNSFDFYIYGSEEKVGIIELLRENLILQIYRIIVFMSTG